MPSGQAGVPGIAGEDAGPVSMGGKSYGISAGTGEPQTVEAVLGPGYAGMSGGGGM